MRQHVLRPQLMLTCADTNQAQQETHFTIPHDQIENVLLDINSSLEIINNRISRLSEQIEGRFAYQGQNNEFVIMILFMVIVMLIFGMIAM